MQKETETTNSYFLSNRSAEQPLLEKARKESRQILKELKVFLTGDIGIRIYTVQHVMGISIAGDLTVNGEICRSYDPIDLCFYDLNAIMLKHLAEARAQGGCQDDQNDSKRSYYNQNARTRTI